MPQKMTQEEFLKQVRERAPQLKDLSDYEILAGAFKRRPDLVDKVEGPNETRARNDIPAARAQARAEQESHYFNPETLNTLNKSSRGWFQGALGDIPANLMAIPGILKSVADSSQGGTLPDTINVEPLASKMWSHIKDVSQHAASDPFEWGRMMGQFTGQPLVMEGATGGIPELNAAVKSTIGPPVRAVGGPIQQAGNYISTGSALAPWGWKLKTGILGGALQKIGQGMSEFGIPMEDLNEAAIKAFRGDKTEPSAPEAPTVTTPKSDIWDQILEEQRNPRTKYREISEPTRQFGTKLPSGTDLGFKPAGKGQPRLPFDEEPPSGPWQGPDTPPTPTPFKPSGPKLPLEGTQSGLREEIGTIPSRTNKILVNQPNPNKIRILKEQGFKQVGEPDRAGAITMERPPLKDTGEGELIPDPDKPGGFKWIKKFTREDVGTFDWDAMKAGSKEAWTSLRKMLGRNPSMEELETAMARAPKSGEETGKLAAMPPKFDDPSREWYQLPDGRIVPVDSTATKGIKSFQFQMKGGKMVTATRIDQPEIEPHGLYGPEYKGKSRTSPTNVQSVTDYLKEQGKSPENLPPGIDAETEQQLRPTAVDNPIDMGEWPPKSGSFTFPVTQPTSVTSEPRFPEIGPLGEGARPNRPDLGIQLIQPPGPTQQKLPFGSPQLDIPESSQAGAGPTADLTGLRQQSVMGQQQLPLGPHLPSPQLDEYGIPQNRDWTPEDIFRINHELQQANRPPVQQAPIPQPEQMHIPEIGDAEIQNYLGQEDAVPPEMNDLPRHSPDKISLIQKLKDVLEQELNA